MSLVTRADIPATIDSGVIDLSSSNWRAGPGLDPILNTSAFTFDANGLGVTSEASSAFVVHSGGYGRQKIYAKIRFETTLAGSEELGVCLRLKTFKSPNAHYYYLRVKQGVARITRVDNVTFTDLDSDPFTPAKDAWFTIVGSIDEAGNIVAVFDNLAGTVVTLGALDAAIDRGEFCIRSGPTITAFRCKEFRVGETF